MEAQLPISNGMEILLVRHGETDGNVAQRHQHDATPLTDRGREQIADTTKHLLEMKPTHLLSSPVLRALESSRMVGLALDIIPETNPLFVELGRPEFLHGNFHKSIGSLWFYGLWYFGWANNDKHGGESYKALRERVAHAQEFLLNYPPDARVVVVSHSVFINFFVAHLCNKKPLNPLQAAVRFLKVLSIKNGSITKVVYDPNESRKNCQWRVED